MGKTQAGTGVPSSYRKDANDKVDVLWKVKIKGRIFLADDIPLHMSLRVFDYLDKDDIRKVKEKVEEFGVKTPDSKKLKFKTLIFHSKHTGKDYFMLKVSGVDISYSKFFNYFKDGYGFSHKEFMSHITIDKVLYDLINKNGLKPEEIEFSPLTIEEGANNTTHELGKSEDLKKSLKHVVSGMAALGALSASPTAKEPNVAPPVSARQPASIPRAEYTPKRMLGAIASVESQNGKLTNHKEIKTGLNAGQKAYGKYGLTPSLIQETVRMNPDLSSKHKKLQVLQGDDLKHYMQDNPALEDEIAGKHLSRLEHHFGKDPSTLGFAWLNGISGTNKAKKEKKDINGHWHARKVKDAYDKEK